MHVNFKDIKNVEIKEFSISGTYDECLEGNYQSVTKYKLERNRSKPGVFYVEPELIDGVLKPYVYKLVTCYQWEYFLNVIWYDDDMPDNVSLLDCIQRVVNKIEFKPNCYFNGLD